MKLAVKYCGGCHCGYDRTVYVKKIEAFLGESLRSPNEADHYDIVFVVCGCPSRCADVSAIHADKLIMIDQEEPLSVIQDMMTV